MVKEGAYTILKQEGYVKLDRRKGAVISLECDKMRVKNELMEQMRVLLAQAICKDISNQEIHEMVDEIFNEFTGISGE